MDSLVAVLAGIFPIVVGVVMLVHGKQIDSGVERIERLERHHPDIIREREHGR